MDAGLNINTIEGVFGYSCPGQCRPLKCGAGFLLLRPRWVRLSPALVRRAGRGQRRGNSSLSPPLHSLVSLVTAITKGRSALGDMDLSQPTKPESCRLLTSPWGLGVTAHSCLGWPGTVPLETEGCTFSTRSGSTDFFQLKNCDYILGLFLAILDPWLQSLPFCVLLFVIESIDVYLIHLAPRFVTRHCFPAFCHLFSQLPSLS